MNQEIQLSKELFFNPVTKLVYTKIQQEGKTFHVLKSKLATSEARVLKLLNEKKGKVVSHDDIAFVAYQNKHQRETFRTSIRTVKKNLKYALRTDPTLEIINRPKYGYMLVDK